MLRQFNPIQKAVLCVIGAALAALLVVHNPTQGYRTRDTLTMFSVANVPLSYFQNGRVATKEEIAKLNATERVTPVRKFEVSLSPLQWLSNGALFQPLATVKNALLFASTLLTLGLLWVFLLRTTTKA